MAGKPPGSVVSLLNHRPDSWANGPEVGDVLETRTGRRYLIVDRRKVGRRASYSCLVMHPDDPYPDGVRFTWEWAKR